MQGTGYLLETVVVLHDACRLGIVEPIAGAVIQLRLRLGEELCVVGHCGHIDAARHLHADEAS